MKGYLLAAIVAVVAWLAAYAATAHYLRIALACVEIAGEDVCGW